VFVLNHQVQIIGFVAGLRVSVLIDYSLGKNAHDYPL